MLPNQTRPSPREELFEPTKGGGLEVDNSGRFHPPTNAKSKELTFDTARSRELRTPWPCAVLHVEFLPHARLRDLIAADDSTTKPSHCNESGSV